MKILVSILSLLGLFVLTESVFGQGSSQENSLDIQRINSPVMGQQFNSVDSFDIEVRIINNGPNFLIAADQFKVSYSVGDGGPNSRNVDTLITVGGTSVMQVGQFRNYSIAKDVLVNGNNNYSTCVYVNGTNDYPMNTNKTPFKCVQYAVSIPKTDLTIENIYYAKGNVNLELNSARNFNIKIYSMTGRKVAEERILAKKSAVINFDAPEKGFYFMQIKSDNGTTTTSKFVVN